MSRTWLNLTVYELAFERADFSQAEAYVTAASPAHALAMFWDWWRVRGWDLPIRIAITGQWRDAGQDCRLTYVEQ
jgi:hypothetical protein